MATVAELEDALKNADAAGDTEAATALADELFRMQSSQPRAPTQPPAAPAKPKAGLLDRAQALASGVVPGLASAFTLPTEVGANVLDIGNAALGAGYLGANKFIRAIGQPSLQADIPAFVRPVDRSKYLGTQANTELQLNKIGVDTQPRRPDDSVSRGLNIAGRLAGGILSGGVYNKLGIPSGITPRPGAIPPAAAPPGTPVGGPPGAPPPPGYAGPGAPLGGVPPATPPAPPPAGAPGGAALPAPIGLNATERATLEAGERLGLKFTPGARTGSPTLRQLEAKLESVPATSGPFFGIAKNNQKVVNREFLKAIGEQGDEVSSAALANASRRIGGVFDEAAANNKTVYDNDLQTALTQIERNASAELQPAEFGQIQKQLENLLEKAAQTGSIDGAAFQNAFSGLGRMTQNASAGVGFYARQVREALQDALIRSVGPQQAAKLKNARDQYRILVTAENRVGAIDVGAGNVKPGLLGNAFANSDKGGYLRGYNDTGLYDVLRAANTKSFGPIVGNSGTATRLGQFPDSLYRATVNAGGNLATRAYLNTPPGVLAGGVKAGNATNELVRDMIGIPRQNAPPIIIGLDAAEEELRKGLYQ
jgi:hypothetical protein